MELTVITHKAIDCPKPIANVEMFDYLFDLPDAQHFSMPVENLDNTFTQWLADRNLFASFLEIFYLPANCVVRRIHTDLDHITDRACKINFIIGGEDAPMQWFQLKASAGSYRDTNNAPDNVRKGDVSPYLFWPREDCELISEAVLAGSNLIHAGIPHVVYTKSKPRVAVSVVIRDLASRQRLTCEEAYSRI